MKPEQSKTKHASGDPEQQAKRAAVAEPSPEDVHEQREAGQKQEGVVEPTRPPAQSEIDKERADWEGMARPASAPDVDVPKAPPPAPTPGAGKKG